MRSNTCLCLTFVSHRSMLSSQAWQGTLNATPLLGGERLPGQQSCRGSVHFHTFHQYCHQHRCVNMEPRLILRMGVASATGPCSPKCLRMPRQVLAYLVL